VLGSGKLGRKARLKDRNEGVTRSRREREGEKASELSINYEAALWNSLENGFPASSPKFRASDLTGRHNADALHATDVYGKSLGIFPALMATVFSNETRNQTQKRDNRGHHLQFYYEHL
jgi:hypothetical protein